MTHVVPKNRIERDTITKNLIMTMLTYYHNIGVTVYADTFSAPRRHCASARWRAGLFESSQEINNGGYERRQQDNNDVRQLNIQLSVDKYHYRLTRPFSLSLSLSCWIQRYSCDTIDHRKFTGVRGRGGKREGGIRQDAIFICATRERGDVFDDRFNNWMRIPVD